MLNALMILALAGLCWWRRPPQALRNHRRWKPWRRVRPNEHALADAVESLARHLRSGLSLHASAVCVANEAHDHVSGEFALVVDRVDRGMSLAESIDVWGEGRGDGGTRLVAAALSFALATGSAQAKALDELAGTLRERLALKQEMRAQGAQARLSALVINLTSMGFTTFAIVSSRQCRWFLFGTLTGWACIVIGVGLDLVGMQWMRAIARRAEAVI